MKKKRKYISPKTKKILQKEINSQCPICENQDVGHFEIHHINENTEDNKLENLLMLCRICHSKITKLEISKEEVQLIKKQLPLIKNQIEFVDVIADELKCNWISESGFIFFYKYKHESKSINPILKWCFINHYNRTIVLRRVIYSGKSLPSGLSGPAVTTILNSIIEYKIPIELESQMQSLTFSNKIQIPENNGFQFDTELYSSYNNEVYPLNGRFYLDFIFEFSNNQSVKIPRIFFNCKSENEELKHYSIS